MDKLSETQEDLAERQEHAAESLQTIGVATTKFKIMLTYTQCMTFLPVVFVSLSLFQPQFYSKRPKT